jgi:uncharacterized protein (TIGR02001 family)
MLNAGSDGANPGTPESVARPRRCGRSGRCPGAWRCSRVLLSAMALLSCLSASAGDWGGSLGIMSDYVYRGLTLSNHQSSLQADVHYYGAAGCYAGVWAASAKHAAGAAMTPQINAYLGCTRTLAEDWSARLSVTHYDYPWSAYRRRYQYNELAGTLAYADRLFLTVAVSPDSSVDTTRGAPADRAALSYDLALRQPLPLALSFEAGVGYYDLRWLVDTGYAYWDAGFAYDLGRLELNLAYIGVSPVARSLFYDDVVADRVVATVLWHF